jgi:penicillin-binding protein 1A
VWLGNDDGVPMDNVAGGGLPARLFREILESASSDRPPSPR